MSDQHHEHHGREHLARPWHRNVHKDWRAWVVVGLMLASMAAYVLSLDEEVRPGGKADGQRMPAAAE